MPRTLIAVADSPFPSLDPALRALKRVDPELKLAKSDRAEDIIEVAREADALFVTYAKLPGDLLRQLKRCKVIGRFGLGVDNVDVQIAAQCGMVVTYVPDYCLQEVSDHAMALILALARKVTIEELRAEIMRRLAVLQAHGVIDLQALPQSSNGTAN